MKVCLKLLRIIVKTIGTAYLINNSIGLYQAYINVNIIQTSYLSLIEQNTFTG